VLSVAGNSQRNVQGLKSEVDFDHPNALLILSKEIMMPVMGVALGLGHRSKLLVRSNPPSRVKDNETSCTFQSTSDRAGRVETVFVLQMQNTSMGGTVSVLYLLGFRMDPSVSGPNGRVAERSQWCWVTLPGV